MIAKSDVMILEMIQKIRNPVLDKIFVGVTSLGDQGLIWILVGIFLFVYFREYRNFKNHKSKPGFNVFLSLLAGLLVGNVFLKNVIRRSRPSWVDDTIELLIKNPTDYSFPSAHTLSSFAAATTIYCYNRKWGIAAYIIAVLIAFSRLYLQVHYPSDVFAGLLLGIGIGFVITYSVKRFL